MSKTLVTCYVDPDLDGTAGAVAYAEYLNKNGVNATAGVMGEMHDEAKYIYKRFNFPLPESVKGDTGYDAVVLADASDMKGLEGNIDPVKVVEIIDHRKINEAHLFPNSKVQIEMVGAAATLVAEKFYNTNTEISKMSATLLYGAIVSNTLNFKATLTTERDVQMAKWLKEQVGLDNNFWKELFMAKSDLSGDKLRKRMEGEFANFEIIGKKFGIVQVEIVNVDELVGSRLSEILKFLKDIKIDNKLDFIFQTTIDLENGRNVFIAGDIEAQEVLKSVLGVKFENNIAIKDGLIMRKQIVPLVRDFLEVKKLP